MSATGVSICHAPAKHVLDREEVHSESSWCFRCRGRHDFMWRVYAVPQEATSALLDSDNPYADVWCEPYAQIECGSCGSVDGDLFPGWIREWDN